MTIKPLEGVRVLDFTALPPGGHCTTLLADLGADVVRVEASSGKGRPSTIFGVVPISRGKRSIALDLRNPKANDVLLRLAVQADVVVENAVPGVMDKRGFGYSQAIKANPRLIWCSITGFGQDGPYAEQPGHDLSYMAHSGLLAALAGQALPWHPGATVSVPAGGLMAVVGIQSALLQRARTGLGCQVDISLSESATWLLSGGIGAFTPTPMVVPAGPDRRLYLCQDGKMISLAAAEPRTWGALCEGLGTPDLADTLHKPDAAEAVTARLTAIFATRPAAEWVALLGPKGAAVTAVNHADDIVRDPHIAARAGFIKVGEADCPVNPVRLTAADGERSTTAATPPHKVGEDTQSVLEAAGFTPAEIEALSADGIL